MPKGNIIEDANNKEIFANTSPDFYFKLIDGSEIKNIFELAASLKNMSDDVFYYHANEHRNDFSNWVRDVFNQEGLAREISTCRNKTETEATILRSLVRECVK
jgi:hypothetical protein